MKAVIDLSEVEDQLQNCKQGDTYSIVFTVDSKTDEELDGTASEVEHLAGEDEENYAEDKAQEEETPEEMPRKGMMAGKKMPRAIAMISK